MVTSLDISGGRLEAAIGSSKMSSPMKRSVGSTRRGGSTCNDGLHSLITLKASECVPGVELILSPLLTQPQPLVTKSE